jgi:hypothetical protein
MKLFIDRSFNKLKLMTLSLFLLGSSNVSIAESDNAHVISSVMQKNLPKPTIKPIVLALINLEDIMPDCQQQVTRAKIKSVQHSESGITTESITFDWLKSSLTVATHLGNSAVLSLDELIDATKFLKTGNTYLIHFQVCETSQERSLVNIYAI